MLFGIKGKLLIDSQNLLNC